MDLWNIGDILCNSVCGSVMYCTIFLVSGCYHMVGNTLVRNCSVSYDGVKHQQVPFYIINAFHAIVCFCAVSYGIVRFRLGSHCGILACDSMFCFVL